MEYAEAPAAIPRMPRTALVLTLFIAMPCVMGYAASPSSVAHRSEPKDGLESYVKFLAQGELDGRRPLSAGSVRARRFIVEDFDRLGLQAWKGAKRFAQPVRFGTNIVGVLPGKDPKLAGQVILISAHYDHLGGGRLGAADNAAGVGVLLDLASRFDRAIERPNRTLCFAAFDCEEMGLWGATAFTSREDFNAKEIVAVVNLDTVRRHGFDCFENTLFMGRSNVSSPLTDAANRAAQSAGLRLLPYNALLAGPCGDHIPFAGLGIPTLFFSTGPFNDYHTKGDTLAKLDWELLRKTSDMIYDAVSWLGNTTAQVAGPQEPLGSKDDLQLVRQIITEMPH